MIAGAVTGAILSVIVLVVILVNVVIILMVLRKRRRARKVSDGEALQPVQYRPKPQPLPQVKPQESVEVIGGGGAVGVVIGIRATSNWGGRGSGCGYSRTTGNWDGRGSGCGY